MPAPTAPPPTSKTSNPTSTNSPPAPPSLSPAIHARLSPSTYLASHLLSPPYLRPNGRSPLSPAPLALTTNNLANCQGSALVRHGDTSVLCGVQVRVLYGRDIAGWDRRREEVKARRRWRGRGGEEDGRGNGERLGSGKRRKVNEERKGDEMDAEEQEQDQQQNKHPNSQMDIDPPPPETPSTSIRPVPSSNPSTHQSKAPPQESILLQKEEADTIASLNLLVPNVSMDNGCSPDHLPTASGAPSRDAQELSWRLLRWLHVTKVVRLEDLEVWGEDRGREEEDEGEDQEGEEEADEQDASYANNRNIHETNPPNHTSHPPPPHHHLLAYLHLQIHISILSLSSPPFPTTWLALLTALRTTIIPSMRYDPDNEFIVCDPDFSLGRKLHLRGFPLGVEFGAFEIPKEVRVGKQQDGAVGHGDAGGANGQSEGLENGRAVRGQEQEQGFIAERKDPKTRFLLDLDAFELRCVKERVMIMLDCSSSSRASTPQDDQPKILGIEKSGGGGGGLVGGGAGGLMGGGDVEEMVEVAGRRWAEVVRVVEGEERKRDEA